MQFLELMLPAKLMNFVKSMQFVKLLIVTRNADARLPGKGNSNSHGARPVY